ncbi:HAMP domain-containing histidine kinase [Alteromonas sp. ALT199]|uniref:sensor histidine kinase n=1 Tax=unclassified Alteromonas TaxID=2614992 RepID=UPI00044C0E94|nr:HAMP domain-containing sensor histidine kinase [Alteromonas sp. ALT199]MBT3134962.1 HAMP domain-containing histidine kinase [Alteromonas sp. ALT199]
MKTRFYQRLSLVTITAFLMMTTAFVWWSNDMQTVTRHQAEQQLHLELAEHLVQDNPLLKDGVFDYEGLGNLFHTLMILGPSFEFYYLDTEGNILTYSAEPGKVKASKVPLEPVHTFLEKSQALPILGKDPRNPAKNKIFSASPVYKDSNLQGYLYVIIGGERYDSIVDKLTNNRLFAQYTLIGVTTLSLFLTMMVTLFAFLTRPINRLTSAMEKVRDSNYDMLTSANEKMEWKRDSVDEVQKLGCAFNDMVDHIQKQFKELQSIDARRRALLADLSHDLRTPLANLQGYIETLAINDEKLSAEERQRFIQITLKNSQNLKRLIDQIFELAYLEAGQVNVSNERFPIGELLHDIAAKFALKAAEHKISLTVAPDNIETIVCTDIEKLERVLTNLIGNAIRHTKANGSIVLAVQNDKDGIVVEVEDSGIGIEQSELQYIFDTRYQASNSQKERGINAGLGLAICKKLVEINGSVLDVRSTLGKGTTFFFKLQKAA